MGVQPFELENMRGDPSLRARFSLSFTAQMMLSEDSVKAYCAAVANGILSYEGTHYRTAWAGISFTAGGRRIAALAFYEDTLCLFLAQRAEQVSGARYKAQDVSGIRRYEKTPAMLPLKSDGAVKNALKKLAELAATLELAEKPAPAAAFSGDTFPREEFESLLQRGLIRPTGKYSADSDGAFEQVLSALSAGEVSVRLSEKKMLRALDEGWVSEIEKCLPAIDELLRRPSHFIAETEEIRPMELTRKITGRSVAHLCQHTDFISSVEGDEVTPSKMLNIIREDSILTYENKFLNTLLANLYFFVSERYRIAVESGVDERVSSVRFTDSFYHENARSLVTVTIRRSEKIVDAHGVQKSYFGTELFKRVERLNDITRSYIESDFVREMGRNYVRPPILRTNAILKNKYFRQCLELWTFLQSYDESGCGLTVEEKLLQPDEKYMGDLFGSAAAQYLLFCRNTEAEGEKTVLHTAVSPVVRQRLNVLVEDEEESVKVPDLTVTAEPQPAQERDIAFALRVALKAAEFYDARLSAGETLRLEKDMEARLRLADEAAKSRFAAISDALSGYDRVKVFRRRTNFAFNLGKTVLARLTLRGSEVLLYLALAPGKLPKSFRVRDVSAVKRYAATPALLSVKTDRELETALKLVERLEKAFALKKTDGIEPLDISDYEMLPFEELMERGLVRRVEQIEKAEREERPVVLPPVQPEDETAENEEELVPGPDEPMVMPEAAPHPSSPDRTEATADYFEPSATIPDTADVPPELAEDDHALPDIAYPASMDYSRPAQKGVDDVGGFLADSRENIDEEERPAPKAGLLFRLFSRRKSGRDKK